MKATQFIKDHGLERARHVLSGLPAYYTHMTNDARMFVSEHNKDLGENIPKQLPNLIRLDDLQRLVESVDTVGMWGGISEARAHLESLTDRCRNGGLEATREQHRILKEAVRDYESIYGEGNEAN